MESPEPVPALLVGCGTISRTWLAVLRELTGVRLVGLVDLEMARAQALREEYGFNDALVGDHLGTALERTAAQVVLDCTVPAAHSLVTIEALERGCDVLGEKPMAGSMTEARAMVDVARRRRRLYAVMQNRRYSPGIVRFRELVRSGRLGALTTLNADFYLGAHFGGFREEMEHVLLLDMAIHTFDQARFISGADPLEVVCHEWNPSGSWFRHGASAVAVFQMSRDIVFTYRGSWCAEGRSTAWDGAWRAVGERGSAEWDGRNTILAEVAAHGEGLLRQPEAVTPPSAPQGQESGHGGAIREFFRCLREGEVPQTVCADNIKSLAMVHGAIESAATRRRLALEEVLRLP